MIIVATSPTSCILIVTYLIITITIYSFRELPRDNTHIHLFKNPRNVDPLPERSTIHQSYAEDIKSSTELSLRYPRHNKNDEHHQTPIYNGTSTFEDNTVSNRYPSIVRHDED